MRYELECSEKHDNMTTDQSFRPKIVIFKTPEEVDQFATSVFVEQVKRMPCSVITLPTGSTQLGMYALIRQTYNGGHLDFSKLTISNLDEYWPLPRLSPFNYAHYMNENLFNHVNIPPDRHYIPDSEALDPLEEAIHYEKGLVQRGPADLTILGIGPELTCHVGFNGPGSSYDSRTHYVKLDMETRTANAKFFRGTPVPFGAITQGIGNILEAKSLLLNAKGKEKARGIKRALEGAIDSQAPASFLRLHPHVTIVMDKDAASLLSR